MIKIPREPENLKRLKTIFYQCWSLETCHPMLREDWMPHNPAIGQNDITALAIRAIFGGDLMLCEKGDTMRYFWNILSSGQKVDLTNWPHKLKKTQERNSKKIEIIQILPPNSASDEYLVLRRYTILYLRVLKLI